MEARGSAMEARGSAMQARGSAMEGLAPSTMKDVTLLFV